MKKSDLRTGMLVKTEDGNFGLVMLNTEYEDCLVGDGGSNDRTWCKLASYNEDLERVGIPSSDIVAVYSSKRSNQHRGSFSDVHRDRLWKRETVSVKLNSEYTAKVDQSKKTVQVGCQTFEFEKIEELYKAIKNEQNKD